VSFASHITCRLADSRVIASAVPQLRQVAVGVLRVGRPFELLAFRLSDNHFHGVLFEDHEGATEFGRRVELSLQARLRPGVRFSHVHVTPIASQSHLRRAFLYCWRQEAHHGTDLDPLFEASNLPDLLGARVLGAWTIPHVRRRLPRIGRADLEGFLPVVPASSILNLEQLADAAAAAVGLATLGGRTLLGCEARRAAVHLGARVASQAAVAAALNLTPRGVRWLLRQEPEPDLLRAVEAQWRLRASWAALLAARKAA